MMSDSKLQNTQPKACVFIFALYGKNGYTQKKEQY